MSQTVRHQRKCFHVVGVSYGGFAAYPDVIQKLTIVAAGVCLEEKDMEEGLLKVSDLATTRSILLLTVFLPFLLNVLELAQRYLGSFASFARVSVLAKAKRCNRQV